MNNDNAPAVLFGWFCTLLHDFPEPEGTVFFNGLPQVGQTFKLPSSNYKEEWQVHSVNEQEMSFTAIKPTA